MSNIELTALRYAAECATQGTWRNGADPCHFDAPEVTDGKTFAYYVPDGKNAAFIAAANPQTVLALIGDEEKRRNAVTWALARIAQCDVTRSKGGSQRSHDWAYGEKVALNAMLLILEGKAVP